MEDIDGEQAVDTRVECPKCRAEGIVTPSGYVTRIIYMPELHPPFRCLAAHGALSREDLTAAGIDPRLLPKP
jgi:hypothetical protein